MVDPVVGQAAVTASLEIVTVVHHDIGRGAQHGAAQSADDGTRGWRGSERGGNVGEAPGGRPIPQVLDPGSVVFAPAGHQRGAAPIEGARVANLRAVPR